MEPVNVMTLVTARHLAMIGLDVNRALAAGTHGDIDISVVRHEAQAGRLIAALEVALGSDVWWAWLTDEQRAALDDEWARIANNLTVEACGFIQSTPGLFLVMTLLLESIKARGGSASGMPVTVVDVPIATPPPIAPEA